MGRRLIPERELSRRGPLWKPPRKVAPSCCISSPFGELSTTRGLITYVLLTRAPLYRGRSPFSLDLHVLGAPLTFVLSQDQTLQLNPALIEVPSISYSVVGSKRPCFQSTPGRTCSLPLEKLQAVP